MLYRYAYLGQNPHCRPHVQTNAMLSVQQTYYIYKRYTCLGSYAHTQTYIYTYIYGVLRIIGYIVQVIIYTRPPDEAVCNKLFRQLRSRLIYNISEIPLQRLLQHYKYSWVHTRILYNIRTMSTKKISGTILRRHRRPRHTLYTVYSMYNITVCTIKMRIYRSGTYYIL